MKKNPCQPSSLILFAVLVLAGACGTATRPPAEVLRGHWESDTQRELYVGDGQLAWVLSSTELTFPFEHVREDQKGREIDIRIVGPGGVTYEIQFDPGYETGTLTEATQSRTVHRIRRVDDLTAPQ